MGSFFDAEMTVVEIDTDNTVTIRKLTWGENKQCIDLCTETNAATGDVEIEVGLYSIERLIRAIVSWDGPGFEDRPVNRDNLLVLPNHIGQQLERAMNELNADLSEEEGNESAAPTK